MSRGAYGALNSDNENGSKSSGEITVGKTGNREEVGEGGSEHDGVEEDEEAEDVLPGVRGGVGTRSGCSGAGRMRGLPFPRFGDFPPAFATVTCCSSKCSSSSWRSARTRLQHE